MNTTTITSTTLVQQLNNLGVISLHQGDIDVALRYFREGIHLHSKVLKPDARASEVPIDIQEDMSHSNESSTTVRATESTTPMNSSVAATTSHEPRINATSPTTTDGLAPVGEKEIATTRGARKRARRFRSDNLSAFVYRKAVVMDALPYAPDEQAALCTTCAVLLYNLGLTHHERVTLYEGYQVGKTILAKAVRFYSMAMHLIEAYIPDDLWLLEHQALLLGLSNNLGQIYYELGSHELSSGFFHQTNCALSRLVCLYGGDQCHLELAPQDVSGLVFNTRLLAPAPAYASAA